MSAACPGCARALPDSVLNGPPQAVVRCEGCGTLLLWSHGKVVRSARSSPSTLMGVPTVPTPSKGAAAQAPKQTLHGVPAIKAPEKIAPANKQPVADKAPPAAKTLMAEAPKLPAQQKTLMAEAPAQKTLLAAEKPHIVSAMVQAPEPLAGPMEDPGDWFDDEPTRSDPQPLGKAPAPLPQISTTMEASKPVEKPKPEPEKKPKSEVKTMMAPAPSVKPAEAKTMMAPAPSVKPAPAAEKPTLMAEAPVLPSSTMPSASPPAPSPPAPSPSPSLPALSSLPSPTAATLPTSTPIFSDLPSLPDDTAPNEKTSEVLEPVLRPASARPAWLVPAVFGGAAVVVVAAVLVMVLGRPSPPKKMTVIVSTPPVEEKAAPPVVAKAAPTVEEKAAPPVVEEKAAPPVAEEKAAPPVAAKAPPRVEKAPPVVAKAPPVERVERPAPVERPAAAPRRSRTLGGKKVVLEYDKTLAQKSPPSVDVPRDEDPATVARARDAYRRGNQQLFAGNSAGAVAAYRESLSIYPGYVAGYRGLGLAYAEEGNTGEALKALRTYVRTVPAANDVPLIQRRIERLEKSP